MNYVISPLSGNPVFQRAHNPRPPCDTQPTQIYLRGVGLSIFVLDDICYICEKVKAIEVTMPRLCAIAEPHSQLIVPAPKILRMALLHENGSKGFGNVTRLTLLWRYTCAPQVVMLRALDRPDDRFFVLQRPFSACFGSAQEKYGM